MIIQNYCTCFLGRETDLNQLKSMLKAEFLAFKLVISPFCLATLALGLYDGLINLSGFEFVSAMIIIRLTL